MGWNAVVGATVTGVVVVNLYSLYKRHRHGGISAQAYTTEVLPLAASHFIVGPVMAQTRAGLLDLFFGGLRSINAYHPAALTCEPYPVLGPKFGAVHFMHVSLQHLTTTLVWRDWATRSPKLTPLAGWVSIVGGLVMSACCSAHLVLMLPIGIGMLLCSPAQPGRPCYTASGWWVGTATKLLAVLHLAAGSTVPTMRAAINASLLRGVFASSEFLGFGAAMSGIGILGPIWGTAHFFLVGLNLWILGSTIQDWAMASPMLRRSSGLINIGSGLLLAALAPSSGYLSCVPDGVAMLLATPTRQPKMDSTTRK